MDKGKAGRLIAQARKEKGLTLRQLAERLHITATAVSKWETGVSGPDVGLLIPLAEELGLSVTELLERRRMEAEEERTPEQGENIVQSAVTCPERSPETEKRRQKKQALVYVACLLLAALETGLLWLLRAPLGTATGLDGLFPGGLWAIRLVPVPGRVVRAGIRIGKEVSIDGNLSFLQF